MRLKKATLKFKITDIFYIVMMIVPIVFGIVLNVLTEPQATEITITGARIFFTIPMPLQDFPVTESQVNSALVLLTIFFFCLFSIFCHIRKQRLPFPCCYNTFVLRFF